MRPIYRRLAALSLSLGMFASAQNFQEARCYFYTGNPFEGARVVGSIELDTRARVEFSSATHVVLERHGIHYAFLVQTLGATLGEVQVHLNGGTLTLAEVVQLLELEQNLVVFTSGSSLEGEPGVVLALYPSVSALMSVDAQGASHVSVHSGTAGGAFALAEIGETVQDISLVTAEGAQVGLLESWSLFTSVSRATVERNVMLFPEREFHFSLYRANPHVGGEVVVADINRLDAQLNANAVTYIDVIHANSRQSFVMEVVRTAPMLEDFSVLLNGDPMRLRDAVSKLEAVMYSRDQWLIFTRGEPERSIVVSLYPTNLGDYEVYTTGATYVKLYAEGGWQFARVVEAAPRLNGVRVEAAGAMTSLFAFAGNYVVSEGNSSWGTPAPVATPAPAAAPVAAPVAIPAPAPVAAPAPVSAPVATPAPASVATPAPAVAPAASVSDIPPRSPVPAGVVPVVPAPVSPGVVPVAPQQPNRPGNSQGIGLGVGGTPPGHGGTPPGQQNNPNPPGQGRQGRP